MSHPVTYLRSILVLLVVAVFCVPATALAHSPHGDGAVFVQSNDTAANAILSFARGRDGSLTPAGSFATGGQGGTAVGAPIDALASQGSLTLDDDGDLLFAVNAGSDTLSVFAVRGTRLDLRQVIPSGGDFPVSVSVEGSLVYVLNAGGQGSISGYRLTGRHVHPIPGSVRSLGNANATPPAFLTAPSQVGITPDGRAVLVATKTLGTVLTYALGRGGRPATAAGQTATGPVPFSFAFDAAGRAVVVDASGSAGAFAVDPATGLSPVGGPAPNGQVATCWITKAGDFFYAANGGSASITGYRQDSSGALALLAPDGVSATTDPGPIDIAATPDGAFVYQLSGPAGTLATYRVGGDGALTRTSTLIGLPPFDGSTGPEGVAVS